MSCNCNSVTHPNDLCSYCRSGYHEYLDFNNAQLFKSITNGDLEAISRIAISDNLSFDEIEAVRELEVF